MLRSFLFVPADSPRKIEKAALSEADALIIDLEDAVAPSQKEAARAQVKSRLADLDFGNKRILVRINALETPLGQADVDTILNLENVGLVIPKVEKLERLEELSTRVKDSQAIYLLIESALGVLKLPDMVRSKLPFAGLMFGAEDYVASIAATASKGRQEILYARSSLVNAAAMGLPAIDTVYTDFRDDDGLRADSKTAKQLGFSGKLAIHPQQLADINEVWTATEKEIADAKALLKAYEQHLSEDKAVFEFKGRMVDDAVVRSARRMLGYI